MRTNLKDLKWLNADITSKEDLEEIIPIGQVYWTQDERETRLINKV